MKTPDFFILGPEKTATSSIYASLELHPDLSPSKVKETHFFDNWNNLEKGDEFYEEMFNWNGKVVFEATPNYFANPFVRQRMRNRGITMQTNEKFVVILRNPVDRVFSHYKHFHSYCEVVNSDPSKATVAISWKGEPREFQEILGNAAREHMFSCGEYVVHLKGWHKYMDEKRFLLLDYNDIVVDYVGSCRKIAEFVGIDPTHEFKHFNTNTDAHWMEKAGLDFNYLEEKREATQKYYEPYNQALFDYIGKDLGWNG